MRADRRHALSALSAAAMLVVAGFAHAADYRVGQRDKAFTPNELAIRVGDTVTFFNDDLGIHNIYSETAGHEFEIKRQSPRQSHTVTFTSPGTVVVGCKYHGQMKLVVTVVP
jgi:plastocyanin